ncbi:MAG TPA: O-antigen ligase family protein [Gemmatimonadaceae bacterium]|nr:O-antigen ligase family protein [Gemmatimonadaceae bacterium]
MNSRAEAFPALAFDAIGERYQNAVAAFTVLAFSSGIPVYVYSSAGIGLAPLHWVYLVVLLAVPIAFRPDAVLRALQSRLVTWCGVYLTATLAAYLLSSRSGVAQQELQQRALTAIAIPTFTLIFSSPRAIRTARVALVAVVLAAVALNFYEVMRPQTLSAVYGRSAGFYINPNISATAITVGMTLCIGVVSSRWRDAFAALAGLGVLVTLSRGLLIAFVFALIVLWSAGAIRMGRAVLIGAMLLVAGAIAVVVTLGIETTMAALRLATQSGIIDRLVDPSVAMGGADYSTNLRMEEARAAWQQFMDSPLIGNGVASTIEWEVHSSTHNIYLRHLAEYGVLGILLFPGLILAIFAGVRQPERVQIGAFAVAILVAGMFSHNVLDEWDALIAFALAAAMSVQSRVALGPVARRGSATTAA